jgi:serine/threonine protein kinase
VANRTVGDRFELKTRMTDNDSLWEAFDVESQCIVLIRLLRITKQDMRGWIRLESTLEEIKKIDCKHIAKVVEWGDCAEGKYIAMEWFDGQSLSQIKLELHDALKTLLSVAKALKELTDTDIIHPLISVDNIFMSDSGVKLYGFDTLLSQRTKLRQMKSNEITNILNWIAPELLSGKKHSVLSNLYSFGLVCFFTLTGELPFKDTNPNSLVWAIKNSTPVPVSTINPNVPVSLENMIKRLLNKIPSARFQTFHEVIKNLEKSISELGSSSSISITTGLMLNRGRIIGKLKELASIEGEIRNPTGNTVLVEGDEGVGKTRFLQDVMSFARNFDMVILNVSCDVSQKEKSWSAISLLVYEIVEEFGIGIIGRSRFKRELLSICPKLGSRAMLTSEQPFKDSKQLKSKLEIAFPWILAEITKKRKGLIVIDDIQNCDNESLELFCKSIEVLKTPELTYLFSASGEEESNSNKLIKYNCRLKRIILKPLSPKQTMEMVSSVLGNKEIPLHIIDMLHNKTKGNPLKILQIVAGLISGGISFLPGTQLESSDIPSDLKGIASMRIKNLDSKTLEILAEAAILGDSFEEDFLIEVSSHPRTAVEETLDLAVMSMILSMIKTASGFKYTFVINELRETLLTSFTPSQRMHFHDRAGRILKKKYEDNLDPYLEDMIKHLLSGSNKSSAIPYLLTLSNNSLSNFQLSKAVELSEVAKDTAVKSGNIKYIVDTAIQLSNMMLLSGDTMGARETLMGTYSAMNQAGIDLANEAKLLVSVAVLESSIGKITLSENNVRVAYNKLGRNLDNDIMARLHVLESMNNFHLNKTTSLSHALRAVEYSNNSDTQATVCPSLLNKAKVEMALGKNKLAALSLAMAKEKSISKGQLICRMNSESFEIERLIESGQYGDAEKNLSEFWESCTKLGSALYKATGSYLKSILLWCTGKSTSSLEFSVRSLELAKSSNINYLVGKILVNIGRIYLEQDRIADTWNIIDECKAFDSQIDKQYETPGLAILRAWYLIYSGNFKRANDIIYKIGIYNKKYSISDRFNARLLMVELYLRKGEFRFALSEIKEIRKEFPEMMENPVNRCELLLLEGDIGLTSLSGSIPLKGKLPRKTIFSRLGIVNVSSKEMTENAIDEAYVVALSSGLEFQSAMATLARARFYVILSHIEEDKSDFYIDKAKSLLEIASMLANSMQNQRLLFQVDELIISINSKIPPKKSF